MAQQDGIQPSSITETLVANIGASAYAQPGSWGYPTQTTTDMNGAPIGDQMEIARNETVADNKPRLVILEQPKARGFRFRYDCEGQSHGGLPGENSERNRKAKSYPTVQLINYRGRARIVVSLVTESDPPLPHAHSIVGRNTENGQCTVEVGPENDMCATFPNLGILHVTRKKVVDVLTERFIQNKAMQITMQGGDPASQLGEVEREAARREADKVSKGMNLSVVRLCFQAYLPDEKGFFRHALEPVFGQKVYDSKAPSAANLKISRIDRPSGSVRGGDEVYLLCDKVQKNDIEVVFYEEGGIVKQEGDLKHWEALGSFGPQDVHHQYAIVFKTPPYYNMAIERPVTVMIVLRRPSDKEASDPKPFTYLPQEFDEERIGQKRRKKLDHYTNFFRGHGGPPGGAPPPPSGGDPGAGGMGDGGQGAGGQGGFFQGYYGGSGPAGPYAFTGYPPTQNPMDYQRQFNQGGGHMHGQPVSGDFPQGFDQAFSHQPGYDGGWGGGDLWGDPMGQPPSYDTHAGGYGYGANDPFAGSHGSLSIRDRGQVPPRPQDGRREGGGTKSVVDLEAEESGFAESNVPSLDQVTEQLHQQLMQSRSELARRQRQAMEVCERLLRALMEWARTRDTRYLLAAQQDIIAVQNSEGDTALHVAIINNHTDAVRALLDVLPQLPPTQTPVVDTQNHLNQAPMHLAVLTKQTDVVDLLLKAHADKMARDRNGNTPLHLAAQQGSVEMVQVLLTSPQQQQPAVPGACTHPELIMLNMAFAIVALTVSLSGCEKIAPMVPDDTTTMPEMMDGDLPIGVVVSLTGKHAELYGLPMQRGFELAREEINMLSDGNLMFVTVDDQSSEAGAVAAVQGLVDQGVSVIVGIAISDFLEDAFPIAQESSVVAFSSVSSAAGLSSIGDYVFRTPIAVDLMNSRGVMATHEKLGYTKVALIYDAADTYSTSSNEEIKKALAAGGVEILAEETIETDGTDFTVQLTNIMNASPDALFVSALSPEMMRVIMQAGELGIPDSVQLIVPDLTPAEIHQVGDAAEGAIAFSTWFKGLDTPGNQAFIQNYQAKYGIEAEPWAAQSYATLHILANAIANAGSADSAAIRDALAQTMDFPTVLGNFSFDANGEGVYDEVVLMVKDGELQLFEATAPEMTAPEVMDTGIPIGVAVAMTGPFAEPYGLPMKRGLELAQEEINMLTDANITFVPMDTHSTVEGAVAAVQGLVDQGVPAIVGVGISTQLGQAFPIANEAGVVAFSPISSAAGLSSLGDYIFRAGLATNILNPVGLQTTQAKLGYTKVATIYDAADTYATSSNEEITNALEASGVEILTEETFQTGDTDFSVQLTNIMDMAPDAVFISALSVEMVQVIAQGRAIGIPDSVHFIVPDLTAKEVQAAGDAAEGAITIAGWSAGSDALGNQAFVQKYQAEYGHEPGPWSAQAYATLHILANAIANAGATDSAAIRDALAQTMDFSTILGNFSFDPNGEAMYDRVEERVVHIVKDGKLQPFE